jgi:hypothetical protein
VRFPFGPGPQNLDECLQAANTPSFLD